LFGAVSTIDDPHAPDDVPSWTVSPVGRRPPAPVSRVNALVAGFASVKVRLLDEPALADDGEKAAVADGGAITAIWTVAPGP
jgi:hypothetical protein